MRKASELTSFWSRGLVLSLCIATFALLSLTSLTWHQAVDGPGTAGRMEEVWPAGPAVWISLSVMLVLGRRSLSQQGQWQMSGWETAVVMMWVSATALLGWFAMYLSGNATGFSMNTHHAMLWTTMTLGVAQLGFVAIVWEHMAATLFSRTARLTAALWGGTVLGISLVFSVFAIAEGLAFKGVV